MSVENINVAIVAHPANPPGGSGGAEMFPGMLAQSLANNGPFTLKVYGHTNPGGIENSEYIACGPHAPVLEERDGISKRRSITEAAFAIPSRLSLDISKSLTQRSGEAWVVIDNDITTAPLAPFLAMHGIPHLIIQHSFMERGLYEVFQTARESGANIVAIAEYQRRTVNARFGAVHDVTIKNGVQTTGTITFQKRPSPDQGIRVGTLARIETDDKKGIRFALESVARLNEMGHPAVISIAGAIHDRTFYDQVISPFIEKGLAEYVGVLQGQEKSDYLTGLHVGGALSNPGSWDESSKQFENHFEEGYSLVLGEMLLHGVIPVSTDSGGAEPVVDAGLSQFIIPLSVIEKEGMEAFLTLSAQMMYEAANIPLSRKEIQKSARTIGDMGRDYAEYIMTLFARQTLKEDPMSEMMEILGK